MKKVKYMLLAVLLLMLLTLLGRRELYSVHVSTKALALDASEIVSLHNTSSRSELNPPPSNRVSFPSRTVPHVFGNHGETTPPEMELSDKYIIYRCQGHCGGMGDRQKGIITSYLLSQMLKRRFRVILDSKCDYSKYVVPNLVPWTIHDDELKGKTTESKGTMNDWKLGIAMKDGNLTEMFTKDVTYYLCNSDYVPLLMMNPLFKTVKWATDLDHHEVYRTASSQLFKLSPSTSSKFSDLMKRNMNKRLMCVHARMGKSSSMPHDANLSGVAPNIPKLIRFLKENVTPDENIFLATDSDDVRTRLKKEFRNVLEQEGTIVHIDRAGGKYECSAMEKVVLDQFMLSVCETFVMCYSGFGRMAAILRGTDEGLYYATPTNLSKSKRQHPNVKYYWE